MIKIIVILLGIPFFVQNETFKISEQEALGLVKSIPFVKQSLKYKYPSIHKIDNELMVSRENPTKKNPYYFIDLIQVDDGHLNRLESFRVNAISGKVEYEDVMNQYSRKQYLSIAEWNKYRKIKK